MKIILPSRSVLVTQCYVLNDYVPNGLISEMQMHTTDVEINMDIWPVKSFAVVIPKEHHFLV